MSKLYRAFNTSEVRFLRWIYSSFTDDAKLYKELKRQAELIEKDKCTPDIFTEFKKDIETFLTEENKRTVEDDVFDENSSCLSRIGFLKRANIPNIYKRLTEPEEKQFWENLQTLCKFRGMLNACGKQLGTMENMAMDFVKRNPSLKPEEYHQRVFEDMLSGGEMSKNLLSAFKEPGTLQNILDNFSSIIRTPGKEKVDLSALSKMVSQEDLSNIDEEFEKLNDQMRESGVNPFATISEAMKQTSTENPEPSAMMSSETTEKMNNAMYELVRKMQEHEIEDDGSEEAKHSRELLENLMSATTGKKE